MRTTVNLQGVKVDYDEVTADEAEKLQQEGAVILDVRNPDERAQKHIKGSVHIPLPELAQRLDELPAGRLLTVCAHGARSAAAAQVIEQATGRTDVSSIAGGTEGWARSGKPIEL
jgi:rhodanese-related sulfurtransferase